LIWSPDWRLLFSATETSGSQTAQAKYGLWAMPVDSRKCEAAGKPERLVSWVEFQPVDLTITADGQRSSFLKTRIWQDIHLAELGAAVPASSSTVGSPWTTAIAFPTTGPETAKPSFSTQLETASGRFSGRAWMRALLRPLRRAPEIIGWAD